MKLQVEEVWLRAVEAIIGATVPNEPDHYDYYQYRQRVENAGKMADSVVNMFEERFREDEE